jgi:SAM-dependent methyltransferase
MGQDHLSPVEQKRRISRGYDAVSHAYRSDRYAYNGSGYEQALALLLPELASHDRVLDLGCGCGIPATQALDGACRVLGADLSAVQLKRARALVPGADLVRADMATMALRSGTLRAVVAFWSIIHVPLAEQPRLLARVHEWLQPHGVFLATVGYAAWVGCEDDWCDVPGATMYWSHADRNTYRDWFRSAGFAIEKERHPRRLASDVVLARKW